MPIYRSSNHAARVTQVAKATIPSPKQPEHLPNTGPGPATNPRPPSPLLTPTEGRTPSHGMFARTRDVRRLLEMSPPCASPPCASPSAVPPTRFTGAVHFRRYVLNSHRPFVEYLGALHKKEPVETLTFGELTKMAGAQPSYPYSHLSYPYSHLSWPHSPDSVVTRCPK